MTQSVEAKIIEFAGANVLAGMPGQSSAAAPESLAVAEQLLGLRLSQCLQTTLEWPVLFQLYDQELRSNMSYDGLCYHCESPSLEGQWGSQALHRCRYTLKLEDKLLGHVEIQRSQPFREHEILLFERSLAQLVYPLRNALAYHEACTASMTDALTGVANRAGMNQALAREIALAQRNNTPLSIIMADIDHFKRVNDSYGHASGDRALQVIAECLGECIRTTDVLARHGGEEFVLILNNTNTEGAMILSERIRAEVNMLHCVSDSGERFGLSLSLGITGLQPKDSAQRLLVRADEALYAAKRGGRNRSCCWDG